MTDADVFVDARDVDVDPLSRAWLESEAASATSRKNVEILTRYAGLEPAGQAAPDRAALPGLARRDPRRGARSRASASAATSCEEQEGGLRACATETTEDLECGIVFRSIGYRGTPLEGLPFDERQRHDPARASGASSDESGEQLLGDYVVGLDQARADGHHRHEQARLPGDRRRAVRGPGRGEAERADRPEPRLARGAAGRARARARHLLRLGGDRPRREGGRRAPRPPAREAHDGRGAAGRRARAGALTRFACRWAGPAAGGKRVSAAPTTPAPAPPRRPARPGRARATPTGT